MADRIDRLLSRFQAAVERYEMIKAGDHIAVGLSGGKDSIALLVMLQRLRRFYRFPFKVTAITLDPCFGGEKNDYSPVTSLCEELEIPHIIKRTRLGKSFLRNVKNQSLQPLRKDASGGASQRGAGGRL